MNPSATAHHIPVYRCPCGRVEWLWVDCAIHGPKMFDGFDSDSRPVYRTGRLEFYRVKPVDWVEVFQDNDLAPDFGEKE